MIFVYKYFKAPYVPQDLEPLSEYIKKYTLNLSDSSIAIDDNEIPFSVISIGFSNILGLCGFQTIESSTQRKQKQNLKILPVPDNGEEYFCLPEHLKSIIKKGGAK